jgi:hypothetical protein
MTVNFMGKISQITGLLRVSGEQQETLVKKGKMDWPSVSNLTDDRVPFYRDTLPF